jgi:hypothetical protein
MTDHKSRFVGSAFLNATMSSFKVAAVTAKPLPLFEVMFSQLCDIPGISLRSVEKLREDCIQWLLWNETFQFEGRPLYTLINPSKSRRRRGLGTRISTSLPTENAQIETLPERKSLKDISPKWRELCERIGLGFEYDAVCLIALCQLFSTVILVFFLVLIFLRNATENRAD